MTRRVVLNGLELYDDDEWILQEVDGLGTAPSRFASGDRSGADGSWAGRSQRAARSYTLAGATVSDNALASEAAMDALATAVADDEVPLTFHYASGPRTAFVRLDGEVKYERITPDAFRWQVPLRAIDPSMYLGDGVRPSWSDSTTRAYETGGVTFPLTFPLTWSSDVVGGQVEYRNPGTTGRVEFRLDGPLTNPVITTRNGDGTRVLGWNITIPEGAWLYVDPERRRAMLNGQASRPPSQRGWPRLSPGSNQWLFNAAGDSSGSLTVFAWAAM